ncbi:MAG: hypothetical protein PWR31_1608 [Bacillota bacterium]|nr:hypothetical protein [Bacillota bacterium]
MSGRKEFYTFRGYSLHSARRPDSLTPSMEDYLEMIYRLAQRDGYTRVLELAAALHVQPPSASRMIQRLADSDFLVYEKYSIIRLTPRGEEIGSFLIHRHNTLEAFLRLLGVEDVLEDAEKIEHNISTAALTAIEQLLAFFQEHPACRATWESYRRPQE